MPPRNGVNIANSIRLKRSQVPGAIALVEGDDDLLLFSRHVHSHVVFKVCHGKPTVLEAIQDLNINGGSGVLAIVDSDFDQLLGKSAAFPNLLTTNENDIEMIMAVSPALEHVLREYSVDLSTWPRTLVLDEILTEASKVGGLRLLSAREGLGLKFDELDFGKFVNRESMNIDDLKMAEVVQKTSAVGILPKELLRRAKEAIDKSLDAKKLCNGHDFIELLSLGLQYRYANNMESNSKPKKIEQAFRLAYEYAYFAQTNFNVSLQKWAAANPNFHVLSATSVP
jgi:Protein of unknown function (DUF4435)